MFSALPSTADIGGHSWQFSCVPILNLFAPTNQTPRLPTAPWQCVGLERTAKTNTFCRLTSYVSGRLHLIMDVMFRAIADGTRREILALVWREERTAGDIATKFTMTRPSVSQHLKVLLDAELVSVRRAGTRRYYRANRQAVAQLCNELMVLWNDRLARLKTTVETSERTRRR